jgi:tryptophan synthase alpha chain
MSKIRAAFEKGKALIAFITCGDPDLETTAAAVQAAAENGAGLIELGIPFSDPTAEGPVIQESSIRALQGGITTDKVLAFVKNLRKTVTIPLVFKTYANVVFSYGAERFFASCGEAGVDGIILPDLPFEEREEFLPYCEKHGVHLIHMVAITSKERIMAIAKAATGFLYIMACPGGTTEELAHIMEVVRSVSTIPCAVCLTADDAPQFWETAGLVDGVIEDAPIVSLCGKYGSDAHRHIGARTRQVIHQLLSI